MDGRKIKRNFVIAHPAEARAVIEYYKLSKDPQHQVLDVYCADGIQLIVSGQGKVAAAAAMAYLGALTDRQQKSIWVNIGIAGHRDHAIGSLWRINKAVDLATGAQVFPLSIVSASVIEQDFVNTFDQPETEYRRAGLYDMEASAFFQAASRFASLECITGFKVISDNRQFPQVQTNAAIVYQSIAKHLDRIDGYLTQLCKQLCEAESDEKDMTDFTDRLFAQLKFTHSQRQQCQALLHSLQVQGESQFEDVLKQTRASLVIQSLRQRLQQINLSV